MTKEQIKSLADSASNAIMCHIAHCVTRNQTYKRSELTAIIEAAIEDAQSAGAPK
jgi:hypothetical protein